MSILFCNAKEVNNLQNFQLNHLGYGAFETFLAKRVNSDHTSILGLNLHLTRLENSCKTLGIKTLTLDYYSNFIFDVLRNFKWEGADALRVRLVIYENDWYLQLEPFIESIASLSLKTVSIERFLPEVKSCSALACVYSQKIAQSEGFDEALLLDHNHVIRETSWGNFFWFDNSNVLYTPVNKILNGVTREIIINLAAQYFKVVETECTYKQEFQAKSCFLTRSSIGVCVVTKIDNKQFLLDSNIRLLQELYLKLYLCENDFILKIS